MNTYIFIFHTIIIATFALGSLALGSAGLVVFVCICCILANLFVIKQISLFGLTATAADAFTVGATIGLNLLQEYFGKEIAKKTIILNFFLLIFYAIVSQIHLLYVPHPADTMHQYFEPLLNFMPRIVIASFSTYLFTQMIDYYLYGILKNAFHNKYIIIRNYASIAFCQLLDTVLFSFFGLYGIIENIWQIIIVSYVIKLISIVIATPFVGFSRKIYRLTYTKSTTLLIFLIMTIITIQSRCMDNFKNPALLGENIRQMLIVEKSGQCVPELLKAEKLCEKLCIDLSSAELKQLYDQPTIELIQLIAQRPIGREQLLLTHEHEDNPTFVERIMRDNSHLINAYNDNQKTILHELVQLNKVHCVKKLLQFKANPNAVTIHGNTPLHVALQYNVSPIIIKDLLAAGSYPSQCNSCLLTPFEMACMTHNNAYTQAFEKYGYLFFSALSPYPNPARLLENYEEYVTQVAHRPLGSTEWDLVEIDLIKLLEHISHAQYQSIHTIFSTKDGLALQHAGERDCEEVFGKEFFGNARIILNAIRAKKGALTLLITERNSEKLAKILHYQEIARPLQYSLLKLCIQTDNMPCLLVCLGSHFNPNRSKREISLLHYAVQCKRPYAIKLLADHNADLVRSEEHTSELQSRP